MDLSDLITPYGVIPSLKAGNKKQALQILSERAAELSGLNSVDIFNIHHSAGAARVYRRGLRHRNPSWQASKSPPKLRRLRAP